MPIPKKTRPSTFDPESLSKDVHMHERKKGALGKVYVWEFPVRMFHWVNAISIFILMVTGIYIGKPFASASIPEEAYYSFLMGWARYIHFYTAFIFTINLVIRMYWSFMGNKYAKSNPFKLEFWKGVWEAVKFYLFLPNKKPHYIGHNKLAELSYWIFIGLGSVIIVLTGYYMYFEPQFDSAIGGIFAYIGILFGGDSFTVRSWHHLVAWGFMVFTVIHIYLAFREDWLSRNGTMSSIFTGYKTEAMHHEEEEKTSEGDQSA